jgi:hypothetical protein
MKLARVALTIVALAGAHTAHAQLIERGYIQLNGVGTTDRPGSPGFGAEAGLRAGKGFTLFAVGGQIKPFQSATLLQPNPFAEAVIRNLGSTVVTAVEAAGVYGAGGVHYAPGRTGRHVKPYILGSLGVARVRQDVRFHLDQGHDVTGPVIRFDMLGRDPSAVFQAPMVVAGTGVSVSVRRLRVDLGYRLAQYLTGGPPVRVGYMTAGLGVRF